MQTQDSAVAPRSGLLTALDIVIAPKAAFATLRETPTWGWAFLIATIIGVIASIALIPAFTHALDASLPAQYAANPSIAKMPADQQQKTIASAISIANVTVKFAWIFIPIGILVGSLVQAVVMLVANAISRGDGTFKKFFALAINVTIVGTALASIVLAVIVLLRGSESFASQTDITNSVPGLGMLVPSSSKALAAFMGAFTIFNFWAVALLAMGMETVGNIKRPFAISSAVVILIVPALIAAGFAK
jgi:hypothetical protein